MRGNITSPGLPQRMREAMELDGVKPFEVQDDVERMPSCRIALEHCVDVVRKARHATRISVEQSNEESLEGL
jgi:hypothetical protein